MLKRTIAKGLPTRVDSHRRCAHLRRDDAPGDWCYGLHDHLRAGGQHPSDYPPRGCASFPASTTQGWGSLFNRRLDAETTGQIGQSNMPGVTLLATKTVRPY